MSGIPLAQPSQSRMVQVMIDGVQHAVPAGVAVAVALLLTGRRHVGCTYSTGAPRAVFCGMGSCYECVATIDGTDGVRTCIIAVADHMRVDTQTSWGGTRT